MNNRSRCSDGSVPRSSVIDCAGVVTQQVIIHQLQNDLSVVIEPMDGVQSVAFTFLVPAGVVYEPGDRRGAMSILCDLSMRGAGERDNRKLVTDLDNLGVERAESVGASHISFSAATLSDHLVEALTIYSDVLRRPHLPESAFEATCALAIQELAGLEDEPRQKVMMKLQEHHYSDPWGRSSMGTNEGIGALKHSEVVALFQDCYQPNGTILAVAGKVDPSIILPLVDRLFGDWEPGTGMVKPGTSEGVSVEHIHQETSQTQIGIAYPSVVYRHDEYFSAFGAVGVLSGGMSARLFTEVREKRGLCYSVYASHHTLRDLASVMCYAGTSSDRAQETLEVTLGELSRLAEGVFPDELDRVKARIKSALIMQQESPSSRSASVARDWYHLGRVCSFEEVHQRVDRLRCDDITDHLGRYPVKDYTIVTLGPQPLDMPS